MDSTEFNKIAAGVIGAFLVVMLLNFVSGKIYGTRDTHHGDEPLAFALEVEDETAGGEEKTEEAPDYAALVANADLANGEKIFRKCKSCHAIEDGKNGVGPHLWGVVGRDIAAIDGFGYSGALTGLEGDWTLTALSGFLKNPKNYASGTKMVFSGLKDAQDRVDLIAYLNEADGTPIELAAAAPANDDAEKPAADEPKPEDEAKPADAPKADDGDKDETKSEGDAKPDDVEKAEDGDAKPADNAANAEGDNTAVAAADANNDNAPAAGGETAAAFAGGDAKAGEKVFRKCKACHKVEDGKKGVGPHLWGVINRDIASVDGFKYSQVMQDLPGNWTATELAKFLADPKGYAKGTKMAFAGLKKEQDIVNLITYLNEADGTPDPLQ